MSQPTTLFQFLQQRHANLNNSGFAHLLNVASLERDEFSISEELIIRKATPQEIDTLRDLLTESNARNRFGIPRRNPFETRAYPVQTKQGSTSYRTARLKEAQWRYCVAECRGNNMAVSQLEAASAFTETRLAVGGIILGGSGPSELTLITSAYTEDYLQEELGLSDKPLLHFTLHQLEDLRRAYHTYADFANERFKLPALVWKCQQLDRIPKTSALKFLGYVSILESLITHQPDPKDPYDSLTRQVRQKMILIGNRSVVRIPYSLFGPGIDPGRVWSRIYEYRSQIAHGAEPDFSRRLQCLKDPSTALEFIARSTSVVLRQALEEPDLIADLREC
jgi:hypothetical protein